MREGIFVGYKDVNIFQIYFCLKKKIKQVRDVTFVEEPKDDVSPTTLIHSFSPKESDNLIIPD